MSERPTPIMKCLRCRKHKAAPLHYLCPKCHAEQNGEPENPGEKILRLERKLAEARESLDFQIKANAKLCEEAQEQRDGLARRLLTE